MASTSQKSKESELVYDLFSPSDDPNHVKCKQTGCTTQLVVSLISVDAVKSIHFHFSRKRLQLWKDIFSEITQPFMTHWSVQLHRSAIDKQLWTTLLWRKAPFSICVLTLRLKEERLHCSTHRPWRKYSSFPFSEQRNQSSHSLLQKSKKQSKIEQRIYAKR